MKKVCKTHPYLNFYIEITSQNNKIQIIEITYC